MTLYIRCPLLPARNPAWRLGAHFLFASLCVLAGWPAPVSAADKTLQDIEARMRAIETNLTLAEQSAGSGLGPVPRSQAGLTRARLESAASALPAVQTKLAGLPAQDPAVASWISKVTDITARIDSLQARLSGRTATPPSSPSAATVAPPAPLADLQADLDRIGEMGQLYGNPVVILQEPATGAHLLEELPAAQNDLEQLRTKYAQAIGGSSPDGRRMEIAIDYLARKLTDFAAFAAAQREPFRTRLEKDFARLVAMGDEAVAQKRPAYFSGGIPQLADQLRTRLELMRAYDPALGGQLTAQLAAHEVTLNEHQAALREAIIAANTLPDDVFQGPDREAAIATATQVWKKRQPDAEILAVRLPSRAWEHEVLWRWSGTQWYKVDRSRLYLHLIVKYDDQLALRRQLTIWKNHLKGDEITATPLWEVDQGMEPMHFLPLAKVQ